MCDMKRPTRLPANRARSPSPANSDDAWSGVLDAKTPMSPSRALAGALGATVVKGGGDTPHYHNISFAIDESGICVSESSNSIRPAASGDGAATPAEQSSSGVSSCGAGGGGNEPTGANADRRRPTHRCEHAFAPRHCDELAMELGDPLLVDRVADDNWCYGTNLRTGLTGIFPQPHAIEVDICEDICNSAPADDRFGLHVFERDTFYLNYLGSVEVAHHKGNDVLVQAIGKLLHIYENKEEAIVPKTVLLSVSYHGVHMIQKAKTDWFRCPSFDYFYSLQNISFCGAHPKQHKYFGFMTKHPLLPRFACHVFASTDSTQPVVEAIGRAFKRSYDEYMAFQHPTEDIFLE